MLVPHIMRQLEYIPHKTWVDVFCGSGTVTFAKPPSEVEIMNDINGDITNFFSVLRDPLSAERIHGFLEHTPLGRDEWKSCAEFQSVTEPVERARQWYTRVMQGFTHQEGDKGWIGVSKGRNQSVSHFGHVHSLPYFTKRMQHMTIENKSFEEVIPLYDHPDTLFYCDPPYMQETRGSFGDYRHEMTYQQHEQLMQLVTTCQSQVIVSGYPSDLYSQYLKDWRLVKVERLAQVRNTSGGRSYKEGTPMRTECIWIKEHARGLFSYGQGKDTVLADVPIPANGTQSMLFSE